MSRHNHHPAKLLALLAAALPLAPLGTARAADFQQQVRDMLYGTQVTHVAPRSKLDIDSPPAMDAQEFARRLLLGTILSTQTQTQPDVSTLTPRDLQARVQRLLLGQEAQL